MIDPESVALDAEIRAALDAGPETPARVARRALGPSPRRASPAAVAALLVAAAALVWLARPTPRPAADANARPAALRIVNHGGVVSAVDPGGASLAVDTFGRPRSAPRLLLIAHGGDS